MSGWIVLAIYTVGFIFTHRQAHIAVDSDMPSRDAGDRAGNAALAIAAGVLWPIALAGYGVYRFLTPTTPRERAAELDARERRIEQLERELGIGQDRP